jgi:hypothetical protein
VLVPPAAAVAAAAAAAIDGVANSSRYRWRNTPATYPVTP